MVNQKQSTITHALSRRWPEKFWKWNGTGRDQFLGFYKRNISPGRIICRSYQGHIQKINFGSESCQFWKSFSTHETIEFDWLMITDIRCMISRIGNPNTKPPSLLYRMTTLETRIWWSERYGKDCQIFWIFFLFENPLISREIILKNSKI